MSIHVYVYVHNVCVHVCTCINCAYARMNGEYSCVYIMYMYTCACVCTCIHVFLVYLLEQLDRDNQISNYFSLFSFFIAYICIFSSFPGESWDASIHSKEAYRSAVCDTTIRTLWFNGSARKRLS